ncbi:hypothetical protein AB0F17_28775 [Nonomuraea sp. NPDC026600]|uniref:hypothetical protein n=1 Tax=Nonomuraea sp. NPDC026600 TaxID=3155363 RepID=UPI0034088702
MTARPEDRAGLALLQAAYERWATMPDITLQMNRRDAYALMCGMQYLRRHPDMTPALLDSFERVGRAAQQAACDDAELYTMAELGWSSAHDVDQDVDPN